MSRPEEVSTKLQRIAELAKEAPDMVITSLSYHIDHEFLKTAFYGTPKKSAPGVDGRTWSDYDADLDANLESLLNRFKSGGYYAPPVKRVSIPKADGRSRPIGMPTLEDKVLQRAVSMVMTEVYEQDFLDCSYGFRPKRSAHQAIQRLWEGLMKMGGGWVVEVDIKSYFDNIVHGHLRDFLDQRVRDGVIRRTINKWLKAGVLEDGNLWFPKKGSPQGGVISPLLANIYLHEVMDKWFETEVRSHMRGRSFVIRYADDIVLSFEEKRDAERVMEVLAKRFGKYGLALHPVKTRMVAFTRPGGSGRGPGSFDFLGFTHYWGKSRKGKWIVKRKTAKDRLRKSLRQTELWCRQNRHRKVSEQQAMLSRKLKGHYGYYGITGNVRALSQFLWEVKKVWRKWLNRRSHGRHMPWERFFRLLERYPLPPIRMVQSVYV